MQCKNFIILLLCSTLIFSCHSSLTENDLEKYIQNPQNGVMKAYENKGFKAKIVYRPTDLIIKQELKNKSNDKSELKKKYNALLYFVLNMTINNGDLINATASDKSLFYLLNDQLSFNLKEHIYILDEKNDTCYLTDFAFPRLYEVSKETSVLLVFTSDQIKSDKFKICLKNVAYTTGIIQFDFDKKDFKNIPSLKF